MSRTASFTSGTVTSGDSRILASASLMRIRDSSCRGVALTICRGHEGARQQVISGGRLCFQIRRLESFRDEACGGTHSRKTQG